MIFGKNKIKGSEGRLPPGLLTQLRSTKSGRWAVRILSTFVLLAIFGDFIANDKPIYCKRNGRIEVPVLKSYLVDLGLASFDAEVFRSGWKELQYDNVIWPVIPYSASGLDFENDRFRSPFGPQSVKRKLDWHWLGTDQLGRDVTAGLIAGARSALLVGLIAMGIASLIGIFLGALAGYFGDDKLRFPRIQVVFMLLGLLIGGFWMAYVGTLFPNLNQWPSLKIFVALGLFLIPIFLLSRIGGRLSEFFKGTRLFTLPMDLIVMRIIEVINAIPGLFLLLALLALIPHANIYSVMFIIGLLSWTGISRFMRGELLKVKHLPFIQTTESMGFSDFRILFRHALPNALGPVIVAITFGIAGAVLTESALSFIGIATSPDKVTWGTLLNESRNNISAWWLAILPGLMIFLMITSLNIIGDRFSGLLGAKQS